MVGKKAQMQRIYELDYNMEVVVSMELASQSLNYRRSIVIVVVQATYVQYNLAMDLLYAVVPIAWTIFPTDCCPY